MRPPLPFYRAGWWLMLAFAGSGLISQVVKAQSTAPLFPEPTPGAANRPPATLTPADMPLPAITPAKYLPLTGSFAEQSQAFWGLNRAKNLARQAAEIQNGGLQKYRAEASMYGSSADAPFNDQGTHWIFTFKGGVPGFTQPTVESEIRVEKDTFKTSVLYNGAIR